jgi:hypothetical protein
VPSEANLWKFLIVERDPNVIPSLSGAQRRENGSRRIED